MLSLVTTQHKLLLTHVFGFEILLSNMFFGAQTRLFISLVFVLMCGLYVFTTTSLAFYDGFDQTSLNQENWIVGHSGYSLNGGKLIFNAPNNSNTFPYIYSKNVLEIPPGESLIIKFTYCHPGQHSVTV